MALFPFKIIMFSLQIHANDDEVSGKQPGNSALLLGTVINIAVFGMVEQLFDQPCSILNL